MYIAQPRINPIIFNLSTHPDELAAAERELQSALRNLGFHAAIVQYRIIAGIAILVVDGKPYGRYDFARHTFVD